MSLLQFSLLCAFVLISFVAGEELPYLNTGCFDCMGYMMQNNTEQCDGGDKKCGIFRVSWKYWADADSPVIEGGAITDAEAFEKCALDHKCAAACVTGYMRRYQKDCNNDDLINCDDFVAIHTLGPYACNGVIPDRLSSRYAECKNNYYKKRGGAVDRKAYLIYSGGNA